MPGGMLGQLPQRVTQVSPVHKELRPSLSKRRTSGESEHEDPENHVPSGRRAEGWLPVGSREAGGVWTGGEKREGRGLRRDPQSGGCAEGAGASAWM